MRCASSIAFGAALFAWTGDALTNKMHPHELITHNPEVEFLLAEHNKFISKVWGHMERDSPPWTPVPQDDDASKRNICIKGKQVPDFYVLGVQKCATSSLANNLMLAGMSRVHGDQNPKEFHWLDHRMDYNLRGVSGLQTNMEEWLSWMPECQAAKRNTLADFTPDYFRVVPRPTDFQPTERDWMRFQQRDVMGPQKLVQMYGAKGSRKLRFAVMFREPLSQMQSAWYHAASFNFMNACKSCKAESFKAALASNLEGLKEEKPVLSPWLWTPMYARQLEPWLQYFNASQFYIIPMRQLTSAKKDNICQDLGKMLEFKANCDSKGVESLHSWSHPHPPLAEDAGEEMRAAFDKFMKPENEKLVKLLAEASVAGMELSNYEGAPGDEEAVRSWLYGSW